MCDDSIVVYLVRRDLRTADNYILRFLSLGITPKSRYTHLLPVYVLPPDQIETSGLLKDGESSPYPPALSENSKVWKCGLHRVKFLAESVWNLKEGLERLRSGLIIRVGSFPQVLESIHLHYSRDKNGPQISGVWMANGFSLDEAREQQEVFTTCRYLGIDSVIFHYDKPLINMPEISIRFLNDVPDVFSAFREQMYPLIFGAGDPIEAPLYLPPLPNHAPLPIQPDPFEIPETLPELIKALRDPIRLDFSFFSGLGGVPLLPPPVGGETCATERLRYVIRKGIVSRFHELNDLEDSDECLTLTGYLSLGCITARQIHREILKLENGTEPDYQGAQGYNGGVNPGTSAVRVELLRRDFLLINAKKYRHTLFDIEGSGLGRNPDIEWKSPNPAKASPHQTPCPLLINGALVQFQVGATGYGLIDAIMRQLLYTGHVGSRPLMLIANFLAKFAGIDWQLGAEWVASLCFDHDTSLQWYKWQHYAGVGPDPSGGATVVSPVHEAFELDPNGSFVRKWMPELRRLTRLSNLFQVGTTSAELLLQLKLVEQPMVTNPISSDTLDLGPSSHLNTQWLHPRIFVPRPQGLVILGPYPRLLRIHLDFTPIQFPQHQQIIYPPTPPGLPHSPPGYVWFPVPGTQKPNARFYLAPHPRILQATQQTTLAWFIRFIILRIFLERSRMHPARAQVPFQEGVQMPNAQNGGIDLPFRDAPRVPHDAPRAPRATGVPTEVPTVLEATPVFQTPPRTQSVAESEDHRGVSQESLGVPQASGSAPQALRADAPAYQPRQVPPNAPSAPHSDSQPSQAPGNAPTAPRADSQPSRAPRDAPRAPRAHAGPSQAFPNASNAPRGYVQRSRAPQSAPTATIRPSRAPHVPRVNFGPTWAPFNGPRAPRADYQPYQALLNYQNYQRYLPYQAPINATNAPRADSWPAQAPQMAPRAPRAMQNPPFTPAQSPQVFNGPREDISSRYPPQSPYYAPTGPAAPIFGSVGFNHLGTVQLMDGAAYYQALQDYYQWRSSDPTFNAWFLSTPEPEEVLRRGMILRFLDSLPPTPPNPSFPPDPPQLLRRTHRRRGTQNSDDFYGSSNQADPSEEVGTTEAATPGAESAQGRQGKQNKRGRRGKRGRGSGKDKEVALTEEAQDENGEASEAVQG